MWKFINTVITEFDVNAAMIDMGILVETLFLLEFVLSPVSFS